MSAGPGFITKNLYHNSPSPEEMKEQFKYRKTLRFYRGLIQDGMMIFPTDLESFPAPVLCTLCEKPVITRAKTERSGLQIFKIAWASIWTVGLKTYPVSRENRDIVHECPVCEAAIATWGRHGGVGYSTKVHKPYRQPQAGTSQHTAENFQVAGYATVHIGDKFFVQSESDKERYWGDR